MYRRANKHGSEGIIGGLRIRIQNIEGGSLGSMRTYRSVTVASASKEGKVAGHMYLGGSIDNKVDRQGARRDRE